MTDEPSTPEPSTPERRVSTRPSVDRDLRERRRELVATMLLSKTGFRQMAAVLARPVDEGGLGITTAISTLHSDAQVIRARWRARMIEDFSGHVSEQMAYYDALLRALTPRALQGNHNAVVDLLGVLDRRAKLLGMDQPDRVLVGVGTLGPGTVDEVTQKWNGAAREEQIARTEQILSILVEADQLRLPGGPPLQNPESNVIDLPVPNEE